MSRTSPAVTVVEAVDADAREAILALADSAARADGVAPLDDQVRLDLEHATPAARHVEARVDDAVVGYGHLHGGSAHLVVHPQERLRGVGTALFDALDAIDEGSPLRVWAHGNLLSAQAFARRRGFRLVRELWQMAGPLSAGLPPATYAEGVSVRTFEPGRDEEAWVAVNAAAFAHHPEQGRMTVSDLRQRMAEPWFDPAGFFLAERDGELLGFHWTKVHPSRPEHEGRVGEVYVLGVSPTAQGLGLGTALTATGLHHLRDRGLDTVILYVEADNEPAIAVYQKLGLRRASVDAMYERP
jgi:mycothiol synthase